MGKKLTYDQMNVRDFQSVTEIMSSLRYTIANSSDEENRSLVERARIDECGYDPEKLHCREDAKVFMVSGENIQPYIRLLAYDMYKDREDKSPADDLIARTVKDHHYEIILYAFRELCGSFSKWWGKRFWTDEKGTVHLIESDPPKQQRAPVHYLMYAGHLSLPASIPTCFTLLSDDFGYKMEGVNDFVSSQIRKYVAKLEYWDLMVTPSFGRNFVTLKIDPKLFRTHKFKITNKYIDGKYIGSVLDSALMKERQVDAEFTMNEMYCLGSMIALLRNYYATLMFKYGDMKYGDLYLFGDMLYRIGYRSLSDASIEPLLLGRMDTLLVNNGGIMK